MSSSDSFDPSDSEVVVRLPATEAGSEAAQGLLPSGLSDLLAPQAAQDAKAVEDVLACFAGFGYQRIKPPLVEFEQEKRIDDMKVKVPLEIESSDKYRREGVMFKYKNLEKGEHRWTFEINFSNRQQDDCKGDDLRIIKKL